MEIQILDWIQTLRTPFLDQVVPMITKLGDKGILWIILAIILLMIPKTRRSGMILVAALIVDLFLCNIVLKLSVARTRPFDVNTLVELLIKAPTDYSFPSGHTAASFASAAALYFAGEKKLWKIVLVIAILIGLTRLYLYVHYPTDVLGGMLVGILSGWIGYRVVREIEKLREKRCHNDTE